MLLILLLVLVAVGWALRDPATPVDTAEVRLAPMLVTLDEEGETRVRERFSVSAPFAGRILRIELEPGDRVVAGETPLATFKPSDPALLDIRSRAEARAAIDAAEATLGQARATERQRQEELEFATAEVVRARRLAEEGIVSVERLDAAELDTETRREALEAARFAVATAQHGLEVARARLIHGGPGSATSTGNTPAGSIALRSPIDGVVLRRLRESEAIVPAGEALIEVGDPRDLEVISDYLSSDAVRIRAGQRVLIERWGGDHSLAGRVERVEPSGFTRISALGVEEQRVNVIVALGEVPDGLGDGYRVEVRVVIFESDEVLQVPAGSLFRNSDDSWAVYVTTGGKAMARTVTVGHRTGRIAQIQSGLEQGEMVVVHPSARVTGGTRVRSREASY